MHGLIDIKKNPAGKQGPQYEPCLRDNQKEAREELSIWDRVLAMEVKAGDDPEELNFDRDR